MPATRNQRFTAVVFVLVFASASRADDGTCVIETPINWHLNPFQEGGYGWPGPFNTSAFKGSVEIVLKRDIACERIDRAFQTAGFRMEHNLTYDRDGVVFRPTGYDRERKVGYVWGTPETLGEGFFGRPPDVSEEEKAARLSAAEAKLLEDRAPMTREFIAVIIPYTNRLGYSRGLYSTDREKASLEKLGADTEAKRLAALDNAVADYVRWVAERRAEEYPAPSPVPRNLLTFTRWSNCHAPQHHFGECGNGRPRPLPDKLAKTLIDSCGTEAKLNLMLSFIYKKGDVSVTFTGFDPERKIGYIWDYPTDDSARLKEIGTLAAGAEADGLRIAWISPADKRFDSAGSVMRTSFAPPYAEKAAAIQKLTDQAAREVALQMLDAAVSTDNYRPALERLERRMKEFLVWAAKP